MMFYVRNVKRVHLEITDKCNAACPQCPRSYHGGIVNPLLPLTELTVEDIKKIFSEDFILKLEAMYACGNYGDPAFAKETLGIYKYFRANNAGMALGMNSNGGIRPAAWWEELAVITGSNGNVTFSIDGLEDTNHIYRRNVKWKTIMRNAEAFIKAGGRARWDFIVFKHNEHQVEEARVLANNMGFTWFEPKKTGRFLQRDGVKAKFIDSTPVKDNDGNIVGKIERPSEVWQNKALLVDLNEIENRHGSFNEYLDKSCISCKVQANKSVFVSSDGYVFPCCWIAGMATYNHDSTQKKQILSILPEGLEALDARKNDIDDIVAGDFFNNIENSWSKTVKDGKLLTCARICGMEFDQYGKQKKDN